MAALLLSFRVVQNLNSLVRGLMNRLRGDIIGVASLEGGSRVAEDFSGVAFSLGLTCVGKSRVDLSTSAGKDSFFFSVKDGGRGDGDKLIARGRTPGAMIRSLPLSDK